MNIIIVISAICSLSFFIQNLSGPFNIFGLTRNLLLKNKYLGLFFYELLSCPWCIGFHSGYAVYLLQVSNFNIRNFILFGLAGSAINALFSIIYKKLEN